MKTQTISVGLSPESANELLQHSQHRDRSMRWLAGMAIEQWLHSNRSALSNGTKKRTKKTK